VQYLITVPGMYGSPTALLAEFALSAVLMGMVLYASNHRLLTRLTPVFVALLTVLYYGVSSSIAGYSVNPARSFASALFAWIWRGIWIYFVAPGLGMLTAATIYVNIRGPNSVYCAKIFHDLRRHIRFPALFECLHRQRERRLQCLFIRSAVSFLNLAPPTRGASQTIPDKFSKEIAKYNRACLTCVAREEEVREWTFLDSSASGTAVHSRAL
jgi:hypothetical protein